MCSCQHLLLYATILNICFWKVKLKKFNNINNEILLETNDKFTIKQVKKFRKNRAKMTSLLISGKHTVKYLTEEI